MYYLLGLWSRLVTSVPYLKGDTPSLLEETVPKITEGFITSRFDSVQVQNSSLDYSLHLVNEFELNNTYVLGMCDRSTRH